MSDTEIQRSLDIYHKKRENLVAEISLPIDVSTLTQIVKPQKRDPLLYGQYQLSKTQIKKIIEKADMNLIIERKTYRYFLACYSVSGN